MSEVNSATADTSGLAVASMRRAMLAVSTVFLLFGITIGMWAAHIALIQARLAMDTATLGFCLLGSALGTIVAQPLVGYVIARVGSRPVTQLFALLAPPALLLPVWSPGPVWLFLSCIVIGVLWGGLNVGMNTQGSEIEGRRGRPTLSLFHACASLGMLGGSTLGGLLISNGFGNGVGVSWVAAANVVCALLVARLLLDAPPQARGPGFVLPNRAVLGLGVLALLMFVIEGGMVDWSAIFLAVEKGFSEGTAPFGFAAFTTGSVLLRLLGNRVVTVLGRRNVVLFGGVLVAIGLAIAILSPLPWLTIAGLGLAGVGASNIVPTIIASAAQTPGMQPSVAIGAVATLMTAGFLVGPPLIGLISHQFGLAAGLSVMALAGVVVAVSAPFRAWPAVTRQAQPSPA